MQYRKTLLSSMFLSVALLTACGGNEGDDVAKNENKEVQQEVAKETVVEDDGLKLLEGYMVVGSETNGYIQIPEDYVPFVEAGVSNDITAFAKVDQSVKVNLLSLGNTSTLNAVQKNLESNLQTDGQEPSATPMTVGGNEAVQIYTYYEADKTNLYVYLIQTDTDITYLSIEYTGDNDQVRDNIVMSFSKTDYSKEKSN